MRAAIEEKLRRQFSSKAPLTEMRVVYILVETRKLLERQGESLTGIRDFEQFLTDYNLPQHILYCRWTKFLHSDAAVIEDCPLTVRANNLRNIKSVTLSKEEAKKNIDGGDERYLLYRIRWTCDGTSGTWDSYNTIP